MKIHDRCYDCLLSRIEYESRLSTADEDRIRDVVSRCRALLDTFRDECPPAPAVASAAHRHAYELLGDPDPYRCLKEESNRIAREVCRAVKPALTTYHDHALASVIANTFDYGVSSHQVTTDFAGFFRQEFTRGFLVDDTPAMARLGSRIVYFTDNAGEVVFDRLFIGFLAARGSEVTVAVKGAPILNDATREDARAAGLERVGALTDTGSGDIGVNLGKIPGDLREALDRSTLVIAKGMANYEALTEAGDLPPVAYLMAVKCPTIAESTGVPQGSLVAMLRE